MTQEQLEEARRVELKIDNVKEQLERVTELNHGWNANGTWYKFTSDQLGNNPDIIAIFKNANLVSKAIIKSGLNDLLKEYEKEFDNI